MNFVVSLHSSPSTSQKDKQNIWAQLYVHLIIFYTYIKGGHYGNHTF